MSLTSVPLTFQRLNAHIRTKPILVLNTQSILVGILPGFMWEVVGSTYIQVKAAPGEEAAARSHSEGQLDEPERH